MSLSVSYIQGKGSGGKKKDGSDAADEVEAYMSNFVVKDDDSGSFVCLICNVAIKRRAHARRHVKEKHLDCDRLFKCPRCENTIKRARTFEKHMAEKHPGCPKLDPTEFEIKNNGDHVEIKDESVAD